MSNLSRSVPAPPAMGWPLGAAVLLSLLLHLAAWFWIQPSRVTPRAGGAGQPLRISLHTRAPPAAPSPAPRPQPVAAPRAPAKAAPLRHRPPPPTRRLKPSRPARRPRPCPHRRRPHRHRRAVQHALRARRAGRSAPVPLGDWVLAPEPWPDGLGAVQITLWIDAEGRIERTLLLGAAADDPRVQALFARIAETPMQPARVGAGDVFSVMTVEIWEEPGDAQAAWSAQPAAPASATAGR
ncbi:hypothetical protein [Ottowia testudinis]|uniref:Uncharacterized protein n=1 Tax=Ottowia testudinis TaxID=2816950 RepID=A0A975CCT8_9BURK|nr:hypothetical protein [Ottowia testudinis]QTD43915.1 hypothetical protein J1M35_12255 [Ottowia testudinis]